MPAACRRARNTWCTAIFPEDLFVRVFVSYDNLQLLTPGNQRDFVENHVRDCAKRLTANDASRQKGNDGQGNGIEDGCKPQQQRFANSTFLVAREDDVGNGSV